MLATSDPAARERRGMRLGLIYLVFLGYPIADLATHDTPTWRQISGSIALLVFAGLYIRLFYIGGLFRKNAATQKGRPYAAALVVLALCLPLIFGRSFVGLTIYAAAASAAVLPPKYVPRAAIGLAAANLAIMLVVGTDAGNIFIQTLMSIVAPMMVVGVRQLVIANQELRTAREENARLAVSEERLRFARDLHDLLGHSLSLIVLKSELAGRMIERDAGRAAAEVHDIESVARQALVEVREAVSGYRRSFDEELVGARAALRAADIAVRLPAAGPPLPAPVESLLGWAIREATTNILRHSGARLVVVTLDRGEAAVTLSVTDDGVGPVGSAETPGGHGLRGLAERMAAAGGSIEAGSAGASSGFRLRVQVPLDAPSYATAPRPAERDPEPFVADRTIG